MPETSPDLLRIYLIFSVVMEFYLKFGMSCICGLSLCLVVYVALACVAVGLCILLKLPFNMWLNELCDSHH